MKRLILALAAACSCAIAPAATRYVDVPKPVPIPMGRTCFITIFGNFIINASSVTLMEVLQRDGKTVTRFHGHIGFRDAEGDQSKVFVDGVKGCQ